MVSYPALLSPLSGYELPDNENDFNFNNPGSWRGTDLEFQYLKHLHMGGTPNIKVWMYVRWKMGGRDKLDVFRKAGLWAVYAKGSVTEPPADGIYDKFFFPFSDYSLFIRHNGKPPGYVPGQPYNIPWPSRARQSDGKKKWWAN